MAGGCGLAAGWPGRCQGGRPEILSYFFIEQSVETRGRTLRGHERLENAHVDARSRRLLPPTQQPPGYQQMDAVTNGSLATNACQSERKGEQPPFPPAGPATLNRSFRAHRKAQRQRQRERERETDRQTDRERQRQTETERESASERAQEPWREEERQIRGWGAWGHAEGCVSPLCLLKAREPRYLLAPTYRLRPLTRILPRGPRQPVLSHACPGREAQ